jgi:hypothetical protein
MFESERGYHLELDPYSALAFFGYPMGVPASATFSHLTSRVMFQETYDLPNGGTITGKRLQARIERRLKNIVTAPGYVIAKVLQVNSANDPDDPGRGIVNLDIIAIDQIAAIREHLANDDALEAANVNLTATVWEDSPYIPSASEIVKVQVGFVENREGEQVLRPTGIAPGPKAESRSMSLAALMGMSEETPEDSGSSPVDFGDMTREQLAAALADHGLVDNAKAEGLLTARGAVKATKVAETAQFLEDNV